VIELQDPNWWQQVPVLHGATLKLREVELCDVESLFDLLTDPRVTEFISVPPRSAAAFEGFVTWAHRQREAGTCVCLVVVPHGLEQPVGLFQIRALDPAFQVGEWGFALGASFWSTGIFYEAATLVVEFAFKTIGISRLEARAVVENVRGNRALEKLGATGEAVLRRSFNRTYTQFLWALVADEWKRPQTPPRSEFDAAKLKQQIAAAVRQQQLHSERKRTSTDSPPLPFFLTDPGTSDE
jgi:RimJ/RimL family protein N-acetyltransferase